MLYRSLHLFKLDICSTNHSHLLLCPHLQNCTWDGASPGLLFSSNVKI